MRVPEKSVKTHHVLRERIINRLYRPGSQLPHEVTLADSLGVSRNTLRIALEQLESENLVQRIRGKGTFVALPATRPLISLLIPCENFLLFEHSSADLFRHWFAGIMGAARELGARLETIAVSPTNQQRDIMPHCFDHIGEHSRVIVPSTWFEPVFGLLKNSGARVCLLDSQLLRRELFEEETASWDIVDFDIAGAVENAVERLYHRGARRIALVTEFIRRSGYPSLEGYNRGRKRFGLPDLSCFHQLQGEKTLAASTREFYEREQFDGVIVNAFHFHCRAESLQEALGIPQEMPLIAYEFNARRCELEETPGYFDFPILDAGRTAVEMLLGGTGGRKKVFQAEFHQETVVANQ